ncbi:hypothetical protein Tco_0233059 [Tanacetum coccineum]
MAGFKTSLKLSLANTQEGNACWIERKQQERGIVHSFLLSKKEQSCLKSRIDKLAVFDILGHLHLCFAPLQIALAVVTAVTTAAFSFEFKLA